MSNVTQLPVVANHFRLYDKAMEIVTKLLGEELTEVYRISVVNKVCKVVVPATVSLQPLCGRFDLTVSLTDNTNEIFVY